MKSLKEVYTRIRAAKPKKIAVAAAEDIDVLTAVSRAKTEGIADAVLFGSKIGIEKIMLENGIDASLFEIIDAPDINEASRLAVEEVSKGRADIIMKGLLDTGSFMKAVLNSGAGLRRDDSVISSIAIAEVEEGRLIFITDPGFIPLPDLHTKKKIIENAVEVMHILGIEEPAVAALSAMETVNPKIASSVDAKELEEMNKRGEIKGCVIAGPISLDLAVSEKSAKHKGYAHPVAGKANLLLVPSVEVGNVLLKSMVYFAGIQLGGVVAGAKVPIVFTSRTDSPETKP